LSFTGQPAAASRNGESRRVLDLQATPQEVMRAVESLEKFARATGVPEPAIHGLMLSLEECGSNIVNHALERDARQKFQVTIERAGDAFVIELRDRGPEFDPTAAQERKTQAGDDDLPGGWGIQLVRQNMDEVRYTRAGGENILRLTRRLASSVGGK
jgi:anti-sigma regulatory factor (Ser/Thr protein kinase)